MRNDLKCKVETSRSVESKIENEGNKSGNCTKIAKFGEISRSSSARRKLDWHVVPKGNSFETPKICKLGHFLGRFRRAGRFGKG